MSGRWQGFGASLRDRASRAAHGAAKRRRHPATIACAYGLIAIATFGHVASQPRVCADEITDKPVQCRLSTYAMVGFVGGMLWPLYWSWELQS